MAEAAWIRVVAPKAAAICRTFPFAERVRPLLRDDPTAERFFQQLMAKTEYEQATSFLAHALPRREAVWWACLCTELAHGSTLPPPEEQGLFAAVRWVLEPIEVNRRAAETTGTALGIISLCGNLALAAFWSGGSLNPPDLPIRPPSPTKTPDAVARAVFRTVDVAYPRCRTIALRQFLAIGDGIARGKHRWSRS